MSLSGKILKQLEAVCPGRVKAGEPLGPRTTWKIGGPAEWLVEPRDAGEIVRLLRVLAEGRQTWYMLGQGSNVLVGDRGVRGLVIYIGPALSWIKLWKRSDRTVTLHIGAGTPLVRVVGFGLRQALSGLEFLTGIPGSAGGAWAMNAGSRGRELKDLTTALTLVTGTGQLVQRSRKLLNFSYRRLDLSPGDLIVSGRVKVTPGSREEIARRMRALVDLRKESQPWRERSGGSVFKNPPGDYAGRLIEAVGCKGMIRGEAQVSERHANFIINRGQARAREVLSLMRTIRQRVVNHYGIVLEPEVRFWGCVLKDPRYEAGVLR